MENGQNKVNIESREKLLNEHLKAESNFNINSIMQTYGKNPIVIINGQLFDNYDSIRKFHEKLGFDKNGSFSELKVAERKRYITEEAIIVEQTLKGKHTGTWQGIAATGKYFEVPVCTIYTFDEENKLSREQVYFDSSQLIKQLKL